MTPAVPSSVRRRRTQEIDDLIETIICAAHQPIGAYSIANEARRMGAKIAPTQVYRSLDRLLEARIVSRIITQKAFAPVAADKAIRCLCAVCGCVTARRAGEVPDVLAELCHENQFSCRETHLEVLGLCDACQSSDSVAR